MENVENQETTKEVENTEVKDTNAPVEEAKEDKFIILPEKLVGDIMTYLGEQPAKAVLHLITGVQQNAQYATMQVAPEGEIAPETEK